MHVELIAALEFGERFIAIAGDEGQPLIEDSRPICSE